MKNKLILFSLLLSLASSFTFAQPPKDFSFKEWTPGMAWFKNAKLGIFIHWGLYSVKGISESWSMYHKRISFEDYMAQAKGFTAENYNPQQWAKLFKEAGARYAVLTTKHHDGFALWPTKLSHLNVVVKTPAKQDLVGPFCDALRQEGLKVGLYFSLCDWSHPDYKPVVFARKGVVNGSYPTDYYPHQGLENLSPWQRFIRFYQGQLEELMSQYQPDLLWFDGDWEHSAQEWQAAELRKKLKTMNRNVILNSRLRGYGDYKTPEQGIPITPPKGPWEFCMTINDSWGYQPKDTNYKSSYQIICTFSECLAMGGNLLLDVGPKADGTIPEQKVQRLKDLGQWIKKHEEAVYQTVAGLPWGHFYGPTTLAPDSQTIYLYLLNTPKEFVALKGLHNKIKKIRVVGQPDSKLKWKISGGAPWNNIPGVVLINVPEKLLDPFVTVLAVEIEGKVKLYRAPGHAVQLND